MVYLSIFFWRRRKRQRPQAERPSKKKYCENNLFSGFRARASDPTLSASRHAELDRCAATRTSAKKKEVPKGPEQSSCNILQPMPRQKGAQTQLTVCKIRRWGRPKWKHQCYLCVSICSCSEQGKPARLGNGLLCQIRVVQERTVNRTSCLDKNDDMDLSSRKCLFCSLLHQHLDKHSDFVANIAVVVVFTVVD